MLQRHGTVYVGLLICIKRKCPYRGADLLSIVIPSLVPLSSDHTDVDKTICWGIKCNRNASVLGGDLWRWAAVDLTALSA